jgi:hypothetical protein
LDASAVTRGHAPRAALAASGSIVMSSQLVRG